MAPTRRNTQGLRKGNPGNKGAGRKPEVLKIWLQALLESPEHRDALAKILRDGDHRHFMRATEYAADRVWGRVAQPVQYDAGLQVVIQGGGVDLS